MMNDSFPDDPLWIALILGIFFSTIGFTLYYFLNRSSLKDPLLKVKGIREENVRVILFRRLSGITIYLIFPLIIYMLITGDNLIAIYTGMINLSSYTWFLPLAALIVFINYLNARTAENLTMYPEIRKKEWTVSLVFLSAVSWILYLFAYEFLFRGLLFIPAVKLFGFWPAVILNIGIYSLVHIPKGIKEGMGAIFLGFVLCLLVMQTGSFWIAFFIHVILALTNEWFSLRANPEMKIIR